MKNNNYTRILILALTYYIWPAHPMSHKHDLAEVDKTTEQSAKKIKTAHPAATDVTVGAVDTIATSGVSIANAEISTAAAPSSSPSASHANIYAAAQPVTNNLLTASSSFSAPTPQDGQNTQDTLLLVSANGKYAAAQSNSSEPESCIKQKTLAEHATDSLVEHCNRTIQDKQFNANTTHELDTIYSREIKLKAAQLLTQKYAMELNKIIKPGIESAFQTRIAPCFDDNDRDYDSGVQYFYPEGRAAIWLEQLDIEQESFIENCAEDCALIKDTQGKIYIYNIETHALREIDHVSNVYNQHTNGQKPADKQTQNATSDDEHYFFRTLFDYCPISDHAIVMYRGKSKTHKYETAVKKIVLYDFAKNQKTVLAAADLSVSDQSYGRFFFLAAHGRFCVIRPGRNTIIIDTQTKRSYTLGPICITSEHDLVNNSRYPYGVPCGDINPLQSWFTWNNSGTVAGYVSGGHIDLHTLPKYDGTVGPFTPQQHKIIFQEPSPFSGETILVNHNQTYTLRVASTGQMSLCELKTGNITQVPISQNYKYQLTHFDYHANTKQLICLHNCVDLKASFVVDLYNLQTGAKPLTKAVYDHVEYGVRERTVSKDDKLKNILFNGDGSSYFVTYQNKTIVVPIATQKEKSIACPLLGHPSEKHAIFFNEKNPKSNKIEAMVQVFDLAKETMHHLLKFNLHRAKYFEADKPAYGLVAVSPNGKYIVSANHETGPNGERGTLENNIVLWNVQTGKHKAFEINNKSLLEQDSFITALSFYNDTYVIGVCRKGYIYIGNIKTMQLHQLKRERTFRDGTPLLSQMCINNSFSSPHRYVKMSMSADYLNNESDDAHYDEQTADGNPRATIDNPDYTGDLYRLYDLEHANLPHALTTIELPQLIMILRLIQNNQFYHGDYERSFRKLSPNLQAIFTKYCIKKELAELAQVIPTHDVQNLICDYYDCKPDTLAQLDDDAAKDAGSKIE